MNINFKAAAIVTSGLLAAAFLMPLPAMAVPGWAQTYRDLKINTADCPGTVQTAIKKITGQPGTFSQVNPTTSLLATFPEGTTGVFTYCASQPKFSCNKPAATLIIVAFSDKGSGEAARWRDQLDKTVGNPVYFDCN